MLLRGLRWGLAGALVAWTVVRLLGLEQGWPLVPLFAFTPWAAAFALLCAVLGAVLRWRLFALVCLACALVLAIAIAPRVIPNRAPEDAQGVRLRVLAINVAARAETAGPVRALVRRYEPDVLAVLELPPEVVSAYDAAGIDELLPNQVLEPRPGFDGNGLYARFPLRPAPRPAGTEFAIAAASMAPPGAAPLELFAVHARAPTSASATRQWRTDLRALPATGEGAMRILAGDFNATLDHHELRELIGSGYHDAAEQAGNGLRVTWSDEGRLPPLVTIDHVLADRRMRVGSTRILPITGSDHHGVLAELVLPRDADRGGG